MLPPKAGGNFCPVTRLVVVPTRISRITSRVLINRGSQVTRWPFKSSSWAERFSLMLYGLWIAILRRITVSKGVDHALTHNHHADQSAALPALGNDGLGGPTEVGTRG